MASIPVQLPGFGLDLNSGLDGCFPHALLTYQRRGVTSMGLTLRERRMLDFVGTITDKPDWPRKVFDEAIVAKWRDEAMAMPRVADDDVYMSPIMFNNCIAELRDKATRATETSFVTTLDAELVIAKSDTAVTADLAAGLRQCVAPLEDVPERLRDWHPGSDKQVLDLLHPSLFPVVFGRTRALRTGRVSLAGAAAFSGKGELTAHTVFDTEDYPDVSWAIDMFQWLPADVVLTETGGSITSYINNLGYEDHKALYGVLEDVVAAAVPLWEACLSTWGDRRRQPLGETDDDEDFIIPEGFTYDIPDEFKEEDGTVDEEYEATEEYLEWKQGVRVLVFREPPPYVPFAPAVKPVHLAQDFPDGLQVIFKLANIHLTPERPSYAGGTWHVEGTLSEYICATAIYYYDEDNITESRLAFRQALDEDHILMLPPQNEFDSAAKYLGISNIAVADLGSVVTRQGRLLAFPNMLQHKVGSFQLKDATKPGHRKILALFLVDPHRRILSSANVPPQQKELWAGHVRAVPSFGELPSELFTEIIDSVDGPLMSMEEAKTIRDDLMEARGAISLEQTGSIDNAGFSFCEH